MLDSGAPDVHIRTPKSFKNVTCKHATKKHNFFAMRVHRSRFLMSSGSEFGCLGLQNQAFGVEGIAKTSFSHMSGLCLFWCHFYMVFDGSGTNFDDVW